MSLQIIQVSSTPASVELSANIGSQRAFWYTLVSQSNGYVFQDPILSPSAIYAETSCTNSFTWAATSTCLSATSSHYIKVYNNSPTLILLASSYNLPGTISPDLTSLTVLSGFSVYNFIPPSFSINVTNISSTNIQLEGKYSDNSSVVGPASWYIQPWLLSSSVSSLCSTGFIYDPINNAGSRAGLSTSINPISVYIPLSYTNRSVHSATFYLTSEGFPLTATANFTFNDPLTINDTLITSRITQAHVVRNLVDLPSATNILWSSNYPSDNIFLKSNGTPYTQGGASNAATLGTMYLSASNNSFLSKTYNYYISSISDNLSASAVFRPYTVFSVSPTLSTVINNIYDSANETINDFTVFGKDAGVVHNIDPYTYLFYSFNYDNVDLRLHDDVTIFNKVQSLGVVNGWDNIIAHVTNPIVDSTSALQMSTYNIAVSSLSSSNLSSTSVIASNTLTLTGWSYPSNVLFQPILGINDEIPTSIIYKEVAPGTAVINLSSDSTTILLPASTNGSYFFYKNSSIIGSGTFTNAANLATKFVTETISIAAPVTINYMLEVNANYYSGAPSINKTYSTILRYVSTNPISTSDIAVFPEYYWVSGSGWTQHVSGVSILPVSNGVLYGNGRSENILLSATSIPGVIQYNWSVVDGTNILYTGSSNTNTTLATIKTNCLTDTTLNVGLSVYNTDSIDAPAFNNQATLLSALTFKNLDVDLSLFTPTLSIPDNVAAPGTITTSIVENNTVDLLYPVNVQIYSLTMNLSTPYWISEVDTTATGSGNIVQANSNLTLSDTAETELSVPKFETTPIEIDATPVYVLTYAPPHPKHVDWCSALTGPQSGSVSSFNITAFPVQPYYYTPNKYVLTGNVSFENLVPENSIIDYFNWISISSHIVSSFVPETVNYIGQGMYGLTMLSYYDSQSLSVENNDAIQILNSYPVYNPNITRIVGVGIAPLPYSCGIGSNEWLPNSTINASFKKIYDNLEYLKNQSKIYDNPPTEYIGWLGSISMADGSTRQRWHVGIPGLDYNYDNPTVAVNGLFNNLQDCVVRDNTMYVSDVKENLDGSHTSTVYILSGDFKASEISQHSIQSINEPFNTIKTIQLDAVDQNRLYLLDTLSPNNPHGSRNKIMIFVYNTVTNVWDLLYFWGGLGSANSHNKYNNPQDIFVDTNNILWVADTDNLAVKKHSRTGSWLMTLTSSKFTTTNKPQSLCKDHNDNLHVLCNNMVIVFNNDGNYVTEYQLNINDNYTKIRPCTDDGFVYITSSNRTIKSDLDGSVQLPLTNQALNAEYIVANRSVFHDEFRNLYICQDNHILKYNDQIKLVSLIKDTALTNTWSLDDIFIKTNEYVQDWVINKSLNRLWDNIEMVRKSIIGKLSYKSVTSATLKSLGVPTVPPDSLAACVIDWWPSFNYIINESSQGCYVVPHTRTFLASEYKEPTYGKGDVLIGINELVTADVLNRVLCQLQENLYIIYDMLSLARDKSSELCNGMAIIDNNGFDSSTQSLSECYPEFYALYGSCLYAMSINGATNPCTNQNTIYTVGIYTNDDCLANITQLKWYVNGIQTYVAPSLNVKTFSYTFADGAANLPQTITAQLVGLSANYSKNYIVTPRLCV